MVREDSQQAGAVNSNNNSNNNNNMSNSNNNYNMFFAPIWGRLTTTGQIAPSNCCRLVVAVVVVSVTQGAGKFGKLPLIRVKMSCLIPQPMGLQRNLRICGNCSNCSLQWNCAPVEVSRVVCVGGTRGYSLIALLTAIGYSLRLPSCLSLLSECGNVCAMRILRQFTHSTRRSRRVALWLTSWLNYANYSEKKIDVGRERETARKGEKEYREVGKRVQGRERERESDKNCN